jgi:hypothetical protein
MYTGGANLMNKLPDMFIYEFHLHRRRRGTLELMVAVKGP